ncbi:hypothetical protein HZS_260 [Henneguya salminicola]|nr:hypothetical protein HZS_260 [Henneguya salminicola]
MNDVTNSINYQTISSENESFINHIHETPKTRRGMLGENYKNSRVEFTIQQKRYLENKLEKEKNEREEAQENLNIVEREFSRFKEETIINYQKLEGENCKLKETIVHEQSRLITAESEKNGLLNSIKKFEEILTVERQSHIESDQMYNKRIERLEKHEKCARDHTIEFYKYIEKHNSLVMERYDTLLEKLVKLAFASYSCNTINISHKNSKISNIINEMPTKCSSEAEEYRPIIETMRRGILLPPCRKKKTSYYSNIQRDKYNTDWGSFDAKDFQKNNVSSQSSFQTCHLMPCQNNEKRQLINNSRSFII